MNESEFDVIFLTETWLEDDMDLEKLRTEAVQDLGMRLEWLNRKKGVKKRGGGVAVLLKKEKFGPTRVIEAITRNEVECLVVLSDINKNKVVFLCVYCPPRKLPKTKVKSIVSDAICAVRAKWGPIPTVVAGDLNDADFNLQDNLSFMSRIVSPITRRGHALDKVILSNVFTIIRSDTEDPLLSDDGLTRSDHKIMWCEVEIAFIDHEKRIETQGLRLKKNAKSIVDTAMVSVNWEHLNDLHPEIVAQRIHSALTALESECTRPVKYKKRYRDKPWVTAKVKKLIQRKNDIYKNSGYSESFRRIKREVERELSRLKKGYYKEKLESLQNSNTKQFYATVRSLNDPDNGDRFDITEATGVETEEEAVEILQEYFASLSNDYDLYKNVPDPFDEEFVQVSQEDVEEAMKKVKISGVGVIGDVSPMVLKLVKPYLARPITILANQMLREEMWPRLYKTETGKLVPKVAVPQKCKDVRLVSMTPYISKVMERILLARIDQVWKSNENKTQMGAKKGIGTSHVLAEIIQEAVNIKAKGEVPGLVFFDFSAAFNSGHKSQMLEGCQLLGVNGKELSLISDFLSDRRLVIKVGQHQSSGIDMERGGCPAGSYLGMQMYVANTDRYDMYFPNDVMRRSFVDDITSVASIMKNPIGMVHDNDGIHAVYDSSKMQDICDAMARFAQEKSYKLNVKKTKLMLMQKSNDVTSNKLVVKMGEEYLETVEVFKLLGVWIDSDLSFDYHIKKVEEKCAKRIWILRNLRNNGATIKSCALVYVSQIRSIIEFAAPILMPFLTLKQMGRLESIQSRALKVIVGFQFNSETARNMCNLPKVEERFKKLTENFVLKEYKNGNKLNWFRERVQLSQQLRNRRKIEEVSTMKDFEFNGPINYYRRLLNSLLENQPLHCHCENIED